MIQQIRRIKMKRVFIFGFILFEIISGFLYKLAFAKKAQPKKHLSSIKYTYHSQASRQSFSHENSVLLQNLIMVVVLFLSINPLAFAVNPTPTLPIEHAPIKIGMTTALTGPASALGIEMSKGVATYFAAVNANGGIDGRQLKLIVLDDQYEPTVAATNMRELIIKDQVLAVIGNVGTPTAVVTIPIANELHTLLFGAFSGSDALRKTPPDRYIINFRASYKEETATMVKNLLAIGIKPDELAFFTQNDAYGDSGYQGAMEALKDSGFAKPEALPVGRYTRNTLNVEGGLAQLLAAPTSPKAIIMVGAYAPNAKFIKLAKKEFPDALFLNVSFVGSESLARELGTDSDNIIVTQVVPPLDDDLPALHEYLKDLNKYFNGSTPTYASLEGFLAAKLFVMGLRLAARDDKLTREGIIDSFETMQNVDIGIGVKIEYSKTDHTALTTVWPTILKNGRFVPFQWSDIKIKKP
jgi:branched-chain amino acid transport system substrate-binding protein